MRMFPLDFEEFLYANGMSRMAVSAMRKKFEKREALDEATHNKMMDFSASTCWWAACRTR